MAQTAWIAANCSCMVSYPVRSTTRTGPAMALTKDNAELPIGEGLPVCGVPTLRPEDPLLFDHVATP
jgi:hypothetical protein